MEVSLRLTKPVVRHGADGTVRGTSGDHMFYYFSPRCALAGVVTVDGVRETIVEGTAWYDHEFGSRSLADDGAGPIAWDWMSVQFDNRWDLTIYCLTDDSTGTESGRYAVLIDPAGRAERYDDFVFETSRPWTSAKTFVDYPTAWRVDIPRANLSFEADAAFAQQEFVTMISRPAFWEGRIAARGTLRGASIGGTGFVEHSGFECHDTLPAFFGAVGKATRRLVHNILPRDLDTTSAAALVGGERNLEGLEFERLSRGLVEPVRTIVDRGGKAWRVRAHPGHKPIEHDRPQRIDPAHDLDRAAGKVSPCRDARLEVRQRVGTVGILAERHELGGRFERLHRLAHFVSAGQMDTPAASAQFGGLRQQRVDMSEQGDSHEKGVPGHARLLCADEL